jgi:hypothetical protein
MIYQLFSEGKLLNAADNVYELDYSTIHHCSKWSVGVIYGHSSKTRVIASVDWTPTNSYNIFLAGEGHVDTIMDHNRIIPIVKAALMVWEWERRFEKPDDTSKIFIKPGGS